LNLSELLIPGPLRSCSWTFSNQTIRRPHAEKTKAAARTMRVDAAAEYLGISPWTLRRHVHNGEIPYIRGKIWRFLITDLDRFLEQSKETREVL
jgi:excisionase family DNA binding protein